MWSEQLDVASPPFHQRLFDVVAGHWSTELPAPGDATGERPQGFWGQVSAVVAGDPHVFKPADAYSEEPNRGHGSSPDEAPEGQRRPSESRGGSDNVPVDEFQREPYRPAQPVRRGPALALRRIAGVDEAILDWVPEERHRYTRLGAIVLNTGILAALSMLALLGSHSVNVVLLLPAALLWGFIILSFDRWLVIDTHGVGRLRMGPFLARLAISILMGLVIAEPLLLWTFDSDLQTQINKDRIAMISTYEGTLKRCNPLSGEAPEDTVGCTREFALNVPGSPLPLIDAKAVAAAELDKLKAAIAAIDQEITKREDLARRECNGVAGTGLTGRAGEGPNCRQLRSETTAYIASSGRAQRQQELDTAYQRIAKLDAAIGTASQEYAKAVSRAIGSKVESKASTLGKPGLLDKVRALDSLGNENIFVLLQSWLLRLLIVVLDALPVITRKMSRSTTYDGLLSRQLIIDSKIHDKALRTLIEREMRTRTAEMQEIRQSTSARTR